MTPQFRTLQDSLEHERAQLVDTSTATDPELVAVFDLAGTVDGFLRAAAGIEGLEFLSDLQEDSVEADDDFYYMADGEPSDDGVPQSLYMVMTNAQAVGELVRLFELWQQDQSVKFDRGLAPLKDVFGLLRSIRRWGPADRVRETGLLDQWAEDIQIAGAQGTSRVEIELWHRDDEVARRTAQEEVETIVRNLGGQVITTAHIPDIAYHGILADVPNSRVQQVLEEGPDAIELLTMERIMFVSPSRPMTFAASEPVPDTALEFDTTLPQGRPRIALLDGVPMANHAALANRLIIDDPDDHSSKYMVAPRSHGSGMASLIAHGDLSTPGVALSQPIYVRPIFEPHPVLPRTEVVPQDQLLVDLIHRAFRRIFEGDGFHAAAAPSVRVVCIALGDPARAFVRRLSPLARLLDWLASKHNVVVVVSGGNVDGRPMIDLGTDSDAEDRESQAVRSLHDRARNRRLLSPAEAVNALTIGAVHSDERELELPDTVLDVMPTGLPAGYSPVGFGYRRSVKPEVLLPGGRQVFRSPVGREEGPVLLAPQDNPAIGPGIGVAAPGLNGETDAIGYSCGTSNSTALAARSLSQILDVLEGLQDASDQCPFPSERYHVVMAKTLLVHASGWHEDLRRLGMLLGLSGRATRRELTRILGYGAVREERATSTENKRVVLIGAGSIHKDHRNTFHFPLPAEMSASAEWRRLTITLGWLSPVNVRSQKYRMARLRFTAANEDIGVRPAEADSNAVLKGTVQHQVFEGTEATGYIDGSVLNIDVDCRVDGGNLAAGIKYGLAASLEVGPSIRSDIHDEIRSRLSQEVPVPARVRVR